MTPDEALSLLFFLTLGIAATLLVAALSGLVNAMFDRRRGRGRRGRCTCSHNR